MTFPFRLGNFEVYPETLELRTEKTRIRLEPKIMDLLVYFSSRPGEVLTKDQLLAEVWEGTNVVEEALQRAVSVLRKALGDDRENPSYLETISKKGYRLLPAPYPLDKGAETREKQNPLKPWMILLAISALGLLSYIIWVEFFAPAPIETPAPKADPQG